MRVNIAKREYTIIWDGVYYFALSDYPHISDWELSKLLAFIEYEKLHRRETEIVSDEDSIMGAVNKAIAYPESVRNAVLPNKITECTACKQNGCITSYFCHTASVENAKSILSSGKLLSSVKAFNKTADELALAIRNGAGDPVDYFEYIMFAWGNCFAGDSLVVERNLVENLGRTPNDEELTEELKKNFKPGVRFYFRHCDIIKHPQFCFDGYHPAKVKDELLLDDYLFACVIPEQYENDFNGIIPSKIKSKVHFISQDGLGLWDWSEKVYNFVDSLEG